MYFQYFGQVQQIYTLTVPGEPNAHKADTIAQGARAAGFAAQPKRSILSALAAAAEIRGARVLICGSLYLAGDVLAKNRTPPD